MLGLRGHLDWTSFCEVRARPVTSREDMPALILLVSSDPPVRHRTDVLLSEAGHLVASASSLQQAKRLLDTVYPDLVIADVRLDAFNGLHIALRCRTDHPLLPVIITHNVADPILQAEAQRLGAAFIVKP